MSHSEYHKIKKNMSYKKVRSIVDSRGHKDYEYHSGGDYFVDLVWVSKSGYYYGGVTFVNGKAMAKYWNKGGRNELGSRF